MYNYTLQYIYSINHFIGIMVLVKQLIMDCMSLVEAMKRGNDELMPIVTKYIFPDHREEFGREDSTIA